MSIEKIKQADALHHERMEKKAKHRRSLFEQMDKHFQGLHGDIESRATHVTERIAEDRPLRVGIVGGGMAGLYAAMLLDQFGIDYHIFEASGERLGGRVRTHYFNNKPHQYAELGAMRFPESWLQSRLFHFWDYLNDTAGSHPGAREIKKIPYILYDGTHDPDAGNLLCYNGMPPVTRNQVKLDNSLLGFDQYFTGPEFDYFKRDGKIKPAQELLDNNWESTLIPVSPALPRDSGGTKETTIGRKRAFASEQATTIAMTPCPVAVSSTMASWPGKPQINSVAIVAMSAPKPEPCASEPNPIIVNNRIKAGRDNASSIALRVTALLPEIKTNTAADMTS